MPENNREWLRTWVKTQAPDFSPTQTERALDIAETAFHGQVGVGDAAQIGVDSVKKLDRR